MFRRGCMYVWVVQRVTGDKKERHNRTRKRKCRTKIIKLKRGVKVPQNSGHIPPLDGDAEALQEEAGGTLLLRGLSDPPPNLFNHPEGLLRPRHPMSPRRLRRRCRCPRDTRTSSFRRRQLLLLRTRGASPLMGRRRGRRCRCR